jgi:large subunit ribosomal protein L6e
VRRVNQAYVIATSTKVDLSKVEIPAKFDDAYFKAPKNKGKSGKFFDKEAKEVRFFPPTFSARRGPRGVVRTEHLCSTDR